MLCHALIIIICSVCRLHFLPVRLFNQLIELGNAILNLRRRILQQLLPFCGDGIAVYQCFMDTAVDLRELLIGEKLVSLDESGTNRKVPLGAVVVISMVVTLPQAVPSITLLPIDKLNAVLAGMPSEYGAVEICQQFIRFP